MRSIWNGAISFGLVSIPIKVVNATESHSVSFRQIHTEDGGRIRYRKVCELEDREVSPDEIGKAYQDSDGTVVPITDDDLAQLPIPTTKTIDIVAFVPSERIDPLQMGTAYYLQASGVPAAKPYALLREALRRSGRVAIAKFALRGRERLGMLRVVDDVIAMHGLLWPDEIRSPQDAAPESDVTVRDAELDLADALMDTLGEVDLNELHDDYREALEELIASKTEGRPLEQPARPDSGGGKVIDLMSALENSVRAAQKSRGEEDEGDEEGGTAEEAGPEAEAEAGEAASGGRRRASGGRRTTAAAKKPSGSAGRTAPKRTQKPEGAERAAQKKPSRKSAQKTATGKPAAQQAAAGKRTSSKTSSGSSSGGTTRGGSRKQTSKKTAAKSTAKTATKQPSRSRKSA